MTLIVSIGRNIGTRPMPTQAWSDYRRDVWRTFDDVFPDAHPVFHGAGEGIYGDVREESYTWVFALDGVAIPPAFTQRLAILARKYRQESIAVTLGQTTFVRGEE